MASTENKYEYIENSNKIYILINKARDIDNVLKSQCEWELKSNEILTDLSLKQHKWRNKTKGINIVVRIGRE